MVKSFYMILTTHAVAGAAVASLFPSHPIVGFTAAFASHFLLDALPHKDYGLSSYIADSTDALGHDMKINRLFFFDLAKIGADFSLSFILPIGIFFLTQTSPLDVVVAGILGGIVPDALQFVYMKTKPVWLSPLQRFHRWVHIKKELSVSVPLALGLQASLSFCVAMLAFIILNHIPR